MTERIEKRCFTVVNVTHNRDNRSPRLGGAVFVDLSDKALFNVGFGNPFRRMTEFCDEKLGGIGVDDVVNLMHRALLHHELNDVNRALGHAVGQFLNSDHFRNDDLADDLFTRLGSAHRLHLFTFALALERRH